MGALQPLFVIMGAGIAFVCLYVGRLASKTTDVNWTKKDIEEQYGYYENRQFKWFNPRGVDYSKISDASPLVCCHARGDGDLQSGGVGQWHARERWDQAGWISQVPALQADVLGRQGPPAAPQVPVLHSHRQADQPDRRLGP